MVIGHLHNLGSNHPNMSSTHPTAYVITILLIHSAFTLENLSKFLVPKELTEVSKQTRVFLHSLKYLIWHSLSTTTLNFTMATGRQTLSPTSLGQAPLIPLPHQVSTLALSFSGPHSPVVTRICLSPVSSSHGSS